MQTKHPFMRLDVFREANEHTSKRMVILNEALKKLDSVKRTQTQLDVFKEARAHVSKRMIILDEVFERLALDTTKTI